MRYFLKIVGIFLVLFITGTTLVKAQDMRVTAVLDSSKIRIGEQVHLDLYFLYNPNKGSFKIQWPTFSDTITEKIEVVNVEPIDTTMPDKNNPGLIQQHQRITISAYDSGYFAIPPFKFLVNEDTANPMFTEALLLEVHTIPTDTSITKTKDIKEPLNEPFSWRWYKKHIIFFAIAAIVLALIILYVIYYNKKKALQIVEPDKPKIPAHITALASLEKIKNEKVWQQGNAKDYYSAITDTVRLYIEERFGINALESTTEELITMMRSQVVDPVSKDKLKQILVLSDLVKFAKMIPLEQEHEITLQNAFDFVNGTKREEVVTLNEDTNEAKN